MKEATPWRKVWIEAALNGPWSRSMQPGIPDTVEAIIAEGIACARAGATIIHTHAYDGGGPQTFDWQVYARIIEGIRAQVDVPVYPSYPTIQTTTRGRPGRSRTPPIGSPISRRRPRGPLEFAVADPRQRQFHADGDDGGGGQRRPAPTSIRKAISAMRWISPRATAFIRRSRSTSRVSPAPVRRWRAAGVKTPIYRFMFSEQFAFGFPPKPYALAAHLALLEEEAGAAPWMVAGLGVEITPLIGEAVVRGGHIRVGLEDAPLGTSADNLGLGSRKRCGCRAARTAPS